MYQVKRMGGRAMCNWRVLDRLVMFRDLQLVINFFGFIKKRWMAQDFEPGSVKNVIYEVTALTVAQVILFC